MGGSNVQPWKKKNTDSFGKYNQRGFQNLRTSGTNAVFCLIRKTSWQSFSLLNVQTHTRSDKIMHTMDNIILVSRSIIRVMGNILTVPMNFVVVQLNTIVQFTDEEATNDEM
eukprot:GEMP01068239.1.p1 GENE.GEMP01068239.1~~GEMP01068239.1.p1  ORF type:complete len:112 (+),score=3.91 GEMP01068239.1:147-482(+)